MLLFKIIETKRTIVYNEGDSYEKLLASENAADYAAISSKIIYCFEIPLYNLIQCFYININKYFAISLFNENDFQLVKTTIIDESSTIVGYLDDGECDEIIFLEIYLLKMKDLFYHLY